MGIAVIGVGQLNIFLFQELGHLTMIDLKVLSSEMDPAESRLIR